MEHFMTLRKILLLVVGLALISQAAAHVTPRKSIPEDGAVLSESPALVSIQFSDLAKFISLELAGSNGEVTKVDVSTAKSVDGLVSVQIPPLQPDKYEVSWRVLSVDGHPVAGRFTFTIEAPNAQ
jgi:copper transport protein